MRWSINLLILSLVAVVGCTRATPPNPPAKTPATAVASPPNPAPVAEPPKADAPPEDEASAPVGDDPAQTPPNESSSEKPAEATVEPLPARPTFATERIIVFAPQNPLIVELQLSIDGQPHVEAMDELVAEVLKQADTDEDGRAMWDELTASPRFKYGQFGNLPIDGDNGPKQIVERYDIDRDGVVDDSELPRFLTRNAGGSRPFSIRGMINDSPSGRRESPLWKLLDADDDGWLSAEEIATAPDRLRSRDVDDDEILIAAEMSPPAMDSPGMMRTTRRGGREAARLLGPHAHWDGVRTSLEEQYALGGMLKAEDFPLSPSLFAHLDENGDGRVRRREIERLNDAPAHLVLAVDCRLRRAESDEEEREEVKSEKVEKEEQPPRLRMISFGDELQGEKSATPLGDDRLLVRAAGSTMLVYLNDTLADANYEQRAEQGLAMFDGDKNGYLEAGEVPEGAQMTVGRFEAVDTDGDEKVYAGEIAAYLAQQQRVLRSQVHARVEGKPDSLREVLDANEDGRIDSREMQSTPERLLSLDVSGDGEIDIDEIPTGLVMGIARGSLENQDALFVVPSGVRIGPASDAPRWFQQMDANRDGSISPREFLGPVELFEKLDTDDDGFLTPTEAGGGPTVEVKVDADAPSPSGRGPG